MSLAKSKPRPLRLGGSGKADVRTQFGALCWRVHKDEVQTALITSRRTRRWVIPKGWPVDGATPAEAAAREAFEEAGLEGRLSNVCLGIYSYSKMMDDDAELPCVVAVFPLKVKKIHRTWPEDGERRRKWFSLKKAASLVDAPDLKHLLREFDPRLLPR